MADSKEKELIELLTHTEKDAGHVLGPWLEEMDKEDQISMLRLMVVRMALKMEEHGIIDGAFDVIPQSYEV